MTKTHKSRYINYVYSLQGFDYKIHRQVLSKKKKIITTNAKKKN